MALEKIQQEKLQQSSGLTGPEVWYPSPEQTGAVPDPVLLSWLTESGLLTARLRSLCSSNFNLHVLSQSPCRTNAVQLRQIVLYCDQSPCIYAETTIPLTTIANFPWLASLGDEPLGERLSNQPDVRRSEFRFAHTAPHDLPISVSTKVKFLWARQSDFLITDQALTVTEVFLPGIASCENTLHQAE